jgi:catechol 2,3-dioxygenase-like lactoylglutathione lyase family enzyme
MLSNATIYPTLPVVDIKRARSFYEQKLGLKMVDEDPMGGLTFVAGNCRLYLYQRGATKADHTVAFFQVENIENEVKELKNKGVKFEEYDMPQMKIKTVNGIATNGEGDNMMKTAWFKDTEGNILGLGQMSKVQMQKMQNMTVGSGTSR